MVSNNPDIYAFGFCCVANAYSAMSIVCTSGGFVTLLLLIEVVSVLVRSTTIYKYMVALLEKVTKFDNI